MAPRKSSSGGVGAPAEAQPEVGFEEALERLETIVDELEGNTLTLEESIARYEEGIRLSRRLTQTLDEAEKRIERLMESDPTGGAPRTEPMPDDLGAPEGGSGGPGSEGELPF